MNDFSSLFSRFILKIVTVLCVFFALALTALFLKEGALHSFEGESWFPFAKSGIMLAVGFLAALVCIRLFFKKTSAPGTESSYRRTYTPRKSADERLRTVHKFVWSLTGIAALVAFVVFAGWGFQSCHRAAQRAGMTLYRPEVLSAIELVRREQARAAQQAAQPPAPKTWHGLVGGIEKTITVTGEWSEEIHVASGHQIKLDDEYPVVWLINRTNVLDPFGGTRASPVKFEVVQLKSKTGNPIRLRVATGLP
jgi:hypothetical protein